MVDIASNLDEDVANAKRNRNEQMISGADLSSEAAEFADEGALGQKKPASMKEHNKVNGSSSMYSRRMSLFVVHHSVGMILSTIGLAVSISIICLLFSGFQLVAENKKGWSSRGTEISKRSMQKGIIEAYASALFNDTSGDTWEKLTTGVVEGNVDVVYSALSSPVFLLPFAQDSTPAARHVKRSLTEGECDLSWYYSDEVFLENNLMAVWTAEDETSLLHPNAIEAICNSEEETLAVMREKKLCGGCSKEDECLPPSSLVFVIKKYLNTTEGITCSEFAKLYETFQDDFVADLILCVNELKDSLQPISLISACPIGLTIFAVDADFGVGGNSYLQYTTSIFHTAQSDPFQLFQARSSFSYGSEELVRGIYDNAFQNFEELIIDEAIMKDLVIACASACMVCAAIALYTGSIWLLIMGITQILFATPLAYAVYRFVLGIRFFSLLNLIGLFVSAALGADDLIVATDKWKNTRLKFPTGSTEDVAVKALPESAYAMFLTTATTSAAFFASCVSSIAPIYCFAAFCGLMVIFNYVLNCLLVFPALCMYDRWLMKGSPSWFVTLPPWQSCCHLRREPNIDRSQESNDSIDQNTFEFRPIQKKLKSYYYFLHKVRWYFLFVGAIILGVVSYYGSTISLPNNIFVQLLPETHPFMEMKMVKREKLLSSTLSDLTTGYSLQVYFGVIPQDTGDRRNPDSLSTLGLDSNFDPSTIHAQTYLLDFCDRFFDKSFAYRKNSDYNCSIERFDNWLEVQHLLPSEERALEYNDLCKGAESIPMVEEHFHSCFIYWSALESDEDVLHWDGKVRIMIVQGGTKGRLNMPLSQIEDEFRLFEAFQEDELKTAPMETHFFHISTLWWSGDTFRNIDSTGKKSLCISVAFSALVVLLSSRSIECTVISVLSLSFILAAAIATLVGLGWELGFLESVCLAILVGVSADFVIHISNSYCQLPGERSRKDRTQYALMNMGPSVIGSAITTCLVAFMMLFCEVVFFVKFAQMLLVTIMFSFVGSFGIFIVIADIMGPVEPSKYAEEMLSFLCRLFKR